MQKKLYLLSALLLSLLTGCTSADSGIILSEATDGAVFEADRAYPESTTSGSLEFTDSNIEVAAEAAAAASGLILDTEPEKEPEKVVVFVCGAVADPGVYEFPEGTRIDSAIKEAGGFLEDADTTYVNLAAVITDGAKLQIPTREEVLDGKSEGIESFDTAGGAGVVSGSGTSGGFATSGTSGESGLVNINTASADELSSLPGIGAGIASKIIRYREENGSFKTKEDIMKVSGIKEKLFSKICDSITV